MKLSSKTVMALPVLIVTGMLASCDHTVTVTEITSPDGKIALTFGVDSIGAPIYSVTFNGREAVAPSRMGVETLNDGNFTEGFTIKKSTGIKYFSEKWAPVWGENDSIDNTYNTITYTLAKNDGSSSKEMEITFRVYDDGIGFRYTFPASDGDSLIITDEMSQFAMPGDITAWWIPGDYDTQEYEYTQSKLSEIRTRQQADEKMGNVSSSAFSPTGVQTSLMLKADSTMYLNIHEAALINYPAMHLDLNDTTLIFKSHLTPSPDGTMAHVALPYSTPWRVVMIGDKATDILASNLIYNLNDPVALDDTSWITPVKYMGVWWEMITGKSAWSYTDAENFDLATFDYTTAKPHGRHAANNENVKRYIDFAAENGFDQLLIEGWNVGWEDWFGKEKDYVFDFVTPYPDFDIKALNEYAQSKGIKLMMHHETSGSIPNYERHIDKAYELMNQYGYNAVK
ncbi:MAG: glycoside hydrolase family 97 N-terminal domain-containing protein, partial [Paramuribaculum sp.]|nr:glycoside hydrolase family 97 N-terminal domain-containing protein [Paramuribaculum sp.]